MTTVGSAQKPPLEKDSRILAPRQPPPGRPENRRPGNSRSTKEDCAVEISPINNPRDPDGRRPARPEDGERMSCDLRLVRACGVVTGASAAFGAVAGLLDLGGGKAHIAVLTTWGAAPVRIAPDAAACVILLALSLWL